MVTLTWHASKYKGHNLDQRHTLRGDELTWATELIIIFSTITGPKTLKPGVNRHHLKREGGWGWGWGGVEDD